MGKIRIKTVGDESLEKEQKNKAKQKQEQKRMAKAPGLKGGEKVASVGPTEEEILKEMPKAEEAAKASAGKGEKEKKKVEKKVVSKRHSVNTAAIKKDSAYSIDEAIKVLKNLQKTKFDETVELHINTKEKGLSGKVDLPHGTGKTLRIKIADDGLIASVEKGNIDFDILVAAPAMMPKLAKVAKILGPRGLMPNPKAGTISDNPQDAIKKLSAGQVNFKTEAQNPIIHLSVGKISFEDKKLSENIASVIQAVGASNINSAVMKSTMSPSIKLDFGAAEKPSKKKKSST